MVAGCLMDAAMAGGEALMMRRASNVNACGNGRRQGALTNGLQRHLMAATVAVEAFDSGGGWGPWMEVRHSLAVAMDDNVAEARLRGQGRQWQRQR